MIKNLEKPLQLSKANQEKFVHSIFGALAGHYDWLNSFLSLSLDGFWRRYAVAKAGITHGQRVLDLCCGTGKLTLELAKTVGKTGHVTGVDFCGEMLSIAKQNVAQTEYAEVITFTEANVLRLPYEEHSFDCCTIGFGIRNVADIPGALREFNRVLKPSGRLIILEFGKPSLPVFKELYYFYFEKILPIIGQLFAGVKGAYQWLPESLRRFPDRDTVLELMEREKFNNVGYDGLTGGIVTVYHGIKG